MKQCLEVKCASSNSSSLAFSRPVHPYPRTRRRTAHGGGRLSLRRRARLVAARSRGETDPDCRSSALADALPAARARIRGDHLVHRDDLLDEDVSVALIHDAIYFQQLVPGHDNEEVRVRTDPFVLLHVELD